ncbi:hypothetical protein GINT2_000141 [Glugoides intestinalis]
MIKSLLNSFELSKENFKSSKCKQKFPSISTAILCCFAATMASESCRTILSNPLSFFKSCIVEQEAIPTLPAKKSGKPTVIFDYDHFISCDKFSFSNLDLITYKRAFCEEFLFNAAYYYELILISERSQEVGDQILKFLDPLGCISYRLYVKDKRVIDPACLNRDMSKLLVFSTGEDEFNSKFNENLVKLPEFNGKPDTGLLDLMHFLINLHFMDIKDFRETIQSYIGKDFIKTFKSVQKKLFQQRNILSFGSFANKLEKVNLNKIEEYKNVKENIKKSENKTQRYRGFIRNFLKNAFL